MTQFDQIYSEYFEDVYMYSFPCAAMCPLPKMSRRKPVLLYYDVYDEWWIWLRYSGLVPIVFIAIFYTGLGFALALAKVIFWWKYGKASSK